MMLQLLGANMTIHWVLRASIAVLTAKLAVLDFLRIVDW